MEGAAACAASGPRYADRNQLSDGTEDLIVAHGLIVERPACLIGALVASQNRADRRPCRNT